MRSSTSIRSHLYNLSKASGIDFQKVVTRYLHERFLYRLSISSYKSSFILKGGNLLYVLQGLDSRPTIDIDLLGKQVNNSPDELMAIFREIFLQPTDDAVHFNLETIQATRIKEQEKYPGVRIRCEVAFDSVRQYIQIDIGFGDLITPKPLAMEYPILLPFSPTPHIFAYTAETVIAEKLQTMTILGQLNSRMKDFFDVYTLLHHPSLDRAILRTAIEQTFQNRNTPLQFDTFVFTEAFFTDAMRIKMWKAYLNKINVEQIDFSEVVLYIREELRDLFGQQ